ncbi:YrhB family protein [Kitasatospora sp. NBC_01287]|uniref:YrhB domain-containing protein n=1 Tax=Kitasatospora sp. NBC_01287 TaxID=2903573 RepID=UPI002258AAAB|nr:YrhB domain-containing protein [Kitasatospora sp. NBC_01287]MCX4747438.1 YrhB family protein [Kitasatospora sp. NBC_01287]
MLSRSEAHDRAKEFLNQHYVNVPMTIVLQPELTVEHDWAWAVRFDSQEHLDTGDIFKAPFNRLLVVPKDGSPAHPAPTAFTLEQTTHYLGTGERPGQQTES